MRRRFLLLVVAGLVLAIPLALALRDWVRDVFLVGLWRGYQAVRIFVEGLPQALVWGLLLLALLVMAVVSLVRRRKLPGQQPEKEAVYQGQVQTVTGWIQRSAEGRYYRWRLARYLGELVCEVMALRESDTPAQLRRRLRDGGLDLPPEMQDYLRTAWSPLTATPAGFFSKLREGAGAWAWPLSREPVPESVIAFLEEQLKLTPQPEARPGVQGEQQREVGAGLHSPS